MQKVSMKSFMLLVVAVIVFSSCSAQTKTPEISSFPTLKATESAVASEITPSAAPSATPGTPSQTANTAANFVPDENAPIKLTLSFTSSEAIMKDTQLYKAAMEYMRRHPDLYIDLRYTVVGSYANALTYDEKLLDSLSKETAEDIVILRFTSPIRRVAASGTLLDFEELIKSDSEVKRTDFFENILDAVKYDSGLYIMPLSIEPDNYVLNKEYTPLLDKPLEEYKAVNYLDLMAAYEKTLASKADGDTIFIDNVTRRLTPFLYSLDIQSLNYDTRTIDIYNESTKDLFEKAMNFPRTSASEESICKLSDFFYSPQVKTLFATSSAGNGSYNDCYLGFEDFKYTSPVPVANFNGDVYFQLYESAAISKNCREPDTAWDFIKFLMGYDTSHPESDFDLTAFYADPRCSGMYLRKRCLKPLSGAMNNMLRQDSPRRILKR